MTADKNSSSPGSKLPKLQRELLEHPVAMVVVGKAVEAVVDPAVMEERDLSCCLLVV